MILRVLWKRLDAKYGDEGKLVDLIMADIRKLKRTSENPSRERERNNSTIVSMIEERLPIDVENEWIKVVTGENRQEISRDKFPYLLKLLLEIKQRIEYMGAEIRKGESRGKTYLVRTTEVEDDRRPHGAGFIQIGAITQYGDVEHS